MHSSFLYFALELPKIIVNDALGSKPNAEAFPRTYFGIDFDNTEYLLTLCFLFLLVLIVNGGITMSLFIFKGITSERLLRRLRFQLFERIHRFPLKQFQKTSQGEVTSMITAEVEPFSQFFADAVELPLFQGGTMLTVLLSSSFKIRYGYRKHCDHPATGLHHPETSEED